MKNLHTKALAWLLVLVSFSSCSLAFDDIATKGSINPEIAVPLLETQYRLGDLMKGLGANDYLKIRPDGQYDMVFNGKYSDMQTLKDLFILPPVITVPGSSSVSIPNFGRIVSVPFPNPAGMDLDSMQMKGGNFQWTFVNDNVEDVEVTVIFWSLTQNDIPYSRTFVIPKNQKYSTLGMETDMKDWTLESDGSGNMLMGYIARIGGIEVPLSDTDPDFIYQLRDLEAKKVFGYVGNLSVSLKTQNLNLDFFKNWSQIGEIRFTDPTLTVTVDNGFGFPMVAQSKTADGLKKDGTKVPITGALKDGFNIGYPSLAEIGKVRQTMIPLNKTNSNIVNVINASPTSISLNLDLIANHNLMNSAPGFVLNDGGVRYKMDASFPLIASAKNFTYTDTMAVNFSDLTNVTDVELKIVTDNTLPVDIGMKVYFIDSTNTRVDSLNAPIVKAAKVFGGFVVNSTSNTTLVPIGVAQFNNIKTAKKVIITSQLTTPTNGTESVFLKADQKFFLSIGLKAKTDYKVKIKI
jgi:hypothetical protein